MPGWHASIYLAWMEGRSGQTIGDTRDGDCETLERSHGLLRGIRYSDYGN